MIEELMATLLGEKPENDIFNISYKYAERDFEDLLIFKKERYNPEKIFRHLKKERKRLQNLKKLKTVVTFSDRIFNTNAEEKLRFREFTQAEERIYRFAIMRDQGADANLMIEKDEINKWTEIFLIDNRDEHLKFFESPEVFIRIAKDFSRTDEKEPFLWLYSYILEFIEICPKSYLENGMFGKFMRSIFGVLFFSKSVENTDYNNISRLSGYFATTYLFDDILDDPGYLKEEKDQYFQNVLKILNSEKYDELKFSEDPLMAFSEYAFVSIREILDEKRGRMVTQSYLAIAKAISIGSHWNYSTSLTNKEIYSIATIKAAYTRIIPAILTGHNINARFLSHCMKAGLIYQLTDDLRDITDDLAENNITPFNYYRYGIIKPDIHPAEIFLAAVSRISEENLWNIPDANDLWIMRISHSLRLLKLKYGEENLKKLFIEMNFSDDKVTTEIAMLGECSSVIIDIEAETAQIYSDIAVNMQGGWSKKPVCGH